MTSLKLIKPHRSITNLAPITLPDFTIVTGINGSGKSHLLEGIKSGAIQVDGVSKPEPEIKLFNWTNLIPNDTGAADPIQLGRERAQFITDLAGKIKTAQDQFIDNLAKNKGSFLPLTDLKSILSIEKSDFDQLAKNSQAPSLGWMMFEGYRKGFQERAIASISNSPVKNYLEEASREKALPIVLFGASEVEAAIPLNWTPRDMFQQNFSQIFAAYHRAWDENRYNTYANERFGETNAVLSDAEFENRFGPPPWEFVNHLLEEAHLDFEINKPQGRADRPFEAKLTGKNSPSSRISFKDLSAGEKIVMSFALCLYNANDRSRMVQYPKVLLFDEIDAPLHPSMTKNVVRVIEKVLVKEKGVKVILTTHSPATVAFAPAESLYRLEKTPHRLAHTSRDQAIQILTSGYISVTEATRFVITEAKSDRMFYSALSRKLTERLHLQSSPNLVFIQASDKKDRDGGGKSQVRNWSSKLPEAGLTQVFGLIDRDESNKDSATVKVLKRYSLENYLLDPIIIYAVLMKEGKHSNVYDAGLRDGNFYELSKLPEPQLQNMADAICRIIEKHCPEVLPMKGTFLVEYLSGKKLSLPVWIRDFRGHDLVAAYRVAFRAEIDNGFQITANDCEGMVDMLTERLVDFIPLDLKETISSLQIGSP